MFTYNRNSRLQRLNEGWVHAVAILLCIGQIISAFSRAIAQGEEAVLLVIIVISALYFFSVSMGIEAVTFLEWDVSERRKKARFERNYKGLALLTSIAMALSLYGLFSLIPEHEWVKVDYDSITAGVVFYGISLTISSLWYFNGHTLCGANLSVSTIQMKPRNWCEIGGRKRPYLTREVVEDGETCWDATDVEVPRGETYLLFKEFVRGVVVQYKQEV